MSNMATDSELEYLSPDFDPASLTVPKLRGIFVSHDVQFPSSAKKPQLVDLFNQKIVPQSQKILGVKSNTKRTSKGITDAESSQGSTAGGEENSFSMLPPPVPETPRRKVSKKSKLAAADETIDEESPVKKSITKKTPSKKSSGKSARASDTETGTDGENIKPTPRRTKKSSVPPVIKYEEPETLGRKSGDPTIFSRDNPFQSGSSPLDESKSTDKKKRKSLVTPPGKEVSKRPSTSGHGKSEKAAKSRIKVEESEYQTSRKFEVPSSSEDGDEAGEEFTPEAQLELVRERAKNGESGSALLGPRRVKRPRKASRAAKTAPWIVILTLFSGYAAWWRMEKLQVGYCGIGTPSTALSDPRIPEWARVIEPQCEPCPQHAFCYKALETRCDHDFVLRPHPLSLGGLVPLPPTCEPDGEKVKRVKAVADKAIESLRERRAKFECNELVDETGKETSVVEIDEEELKQEVSKKRRKGMSDVEFDDLWKGALGEIKGREEVVTNPDGSSSRLSSTSLARIPLRCALRRSVSRALARYRGTISLLVVAAAFVLYIVRRTQLARQDNARVPDLVAFTLDKLATQASLHASDKDTWPEGWISVGQLRDDVLRDEFSINRRENLWKKVKTVVESNTNVRASVREDRMGEVSRCWEWIGAVKKLEDRRDSKRWSPEMGSRDEIAGKRWEENRPLW